MFFPAGFPLRLKNGLTNQSSPLLYSVFGTPNWRGATLSFAKNHPAKAEDCAHKHSSTHTLWLVLQGVCTSQGAPPGILAAEERYSELFRTVLEHTCFRTGIFSTAFFARCACPVCSTPREKRGCDHYLEAEEVRKETYGYQGDNVSLAAMGQ